jgi:UDP-3-O-[3-hydroxymyristoyl] glucosamine N-acyltransferase
MEERFSFSTETLCGVYAPVSGAFQGFTLKNASTAAEPRSNTLLFIQAKRWRDAMETPLSGVKESLILTEPGVVFTNSEIAARNDIIVSQNARLDFAKILSKILAAQNSSRVYASENNIVVGENVNIGEETRLEPFVFIDHDVSIGKHCRIKTGAKIRANTVIGDCAVVGENAVIGGQGLGAEKDETGRNYRIPHIGGVRIGDFVEIGALTAVLSGTILPTRIEDCVLIDDQCHVAHNCQIGRSTVLTASAELCGSARIGKNCFIAPNATIRNGVSLGDGCFVGQAASVTKSLPAGSIVAGNPAETLEEFKLGRKLYRAALENLKLEKGATKP